MYQVDKNDHVNKIEDLPQSSTGAPLPFVIGDEHSVAIAYLLDRLPDGWQEIGDEPPDQLPFCELATIVHFQSCLAHYFGSPNDEAFEGHPLASRGLQPYGSFEILNSSWIRLMEKRNRVHPSHSPDRWFDKRHVALTFHDSIFECVAQSFDVQVLWGNEALLIQTMGNIVFGKQTDDLEP